LKPSVTLAGEVSVVSAASCRTEAVEFVARQVGVDPDEVGFYEWTGRTIEYPPLADPGAPGLPGVPGSKRGLDRD